MKEKLLFSSILKDKKFLTFLPFAIAAFFFLSLNHHE